MIPEEKNGLNLLVWRHGKINETKMLVTVSYMASITIDE